MKTVAIIGAGPAGLATAYELLNSSEEYKVIIFEKESMVGGLSKTYEFEGGRVDIGGHRFFTKDEDVLELWENVLPKGNQGMLLRKRSSHIIWDSRLISYPIRLDAETVKTMGLIRGLKAVISYLYSRLKKADISNLEDFYINRFGKELYSVFFKNYTYKLWGVPANELSSDWGLQRVRKISFGELLLSAIKGSKEDDNMRSLIDSYHYPSYGSGQLWNALGDKVISLGGEIRVNAPIEGIKLRNNNVSFIEYRSGGCLKSEAFDWVVSSMPLNELVYVMDGASLEARNICSRLHYRDMIIVAVELSESCMGSTFAKAKEDSWLYVQDETLVFGRCQILNNWSPYAFKNTERILLEVEFFCNKEDVLWEKDDCTLLEQTMADLIKCGICETEAVFSYFVKRIEKAYPVYMDGYYQLPVVQDWVNRVDNLLCVGRNGQHRYNNMDQSVKSGLCAARIIMGKEKDRKSIWEDSASQEYLEELKSS